MISKLYWLVEMVIIGIGLFLNDYASKRSGLYRHFYYREYQFTQTWFTETRRWIWAILAIVIIILAVFALIYSKKLIQVYYLFSWRGHWLMIALLALSELGILLFLTDKELLIMYPYFLVGLPILALINLIGCILILFFHVNGKNTSKVGKA